jgi:hypothetical protein
MIKMTSSLELDNSSSQCMKWEQMVDVPIRETALTIPKEISTGIYQWNWKEVEKFTSQSSTQHLTKRSRGIQHAVLYPIMNRIRPFDDVEIGVGLNANSVTLLVQQENDKDFYQCPACMETKDGIIVRCQTKASLNTVKACLKNKHDAVLQQVAVHCTVKNKKMNVVSRKQHSFNGEMFVSTNMYTCGALNIYKGVNKRCDRKTRGIKFCHAHREIEDERMLLHNIWDNGKETEILSFDTNNKEIRLVSNIQFSQILCRFVGELDMKNIAGSLVKPWQQPLKLILTGETE